LQVIAQKKEKKLKKKILWKIPCLKESPKFATKKISAKPTHPPMIN